MARPATPCPFCGGARSLDEHEKPRCFQADCAIREARIAKAWVDWRGVPRTRRSQPEAERVRQKANFRLLVRVQALLREHAASEGITMSEYVERWVLGEEKRRLEQGEKR